MIDLDADLKLRQESIRATRRENRAKRQKEREEYTQKKLSGIATDNPVANIKEVKQPEKSFSERLLDKFSSPDKEEKVDPKKVSKTENLIAHVLPIAISGMIAVYSKRLFREEFQSCAPTKEEVSSILLPVFSVINRHVKAGTEISQDVLDITTALLASITVTTRMAITAQELRIYYAENHRSNNGSTNNGSTGNSTSQVARNIQSGFTENNAGQYVQSRVRNDRANGHGNDRGDTDEERTWQAEQVARLMRRDRAGRASLGLAPGLRTEN